MPELMRDELRAGYRIGFLLAADRAGLVVVQRTCTLQRGIAARQPNELQIAAGDGSLHKTEWIERILSLQDQLVMKRRCLGTYRLEGVHELKAPTEIVAGPHSDPSFSPPLQSSAARRSMACPRL